MSNQKTISFVLQTEWDGFEIRPTNGKKSASWSTGWSIGNKHRGQSSFEIARDAGYSVLGTRYSVLGTRYSVLGTRYSLLGTRYSVLGTPYSVLRTPYSVLRTPYSVLRTPYSVLRTRYFFTTHPSLTHHSPV